MNKPLACYIPHLNVIVVIHNEGVENGETWYRTCEGVRYREELVFLYHIEDVRILKRSDVKIALSTAIAISL